MSNIKHNEFSVQAGRAHLGASDLGVDPTSPGLGVRPALGRCPPDAVDGVALRVFSPCNYRGRYNTRDIQHMAVQYKGVVQHMTNTNVCIAVSIE